MSASSLRYGPVHANSNVICAMDIRVGGTDPGCSDILEIALLPLNHSYQPHKEFNLFHARIRPSWPVDPKVSKLSKATLQEYRESSFDSVGTFALFEHWFASLGMKQHKKIIPLVWDWARMKPFLQMWAGETNFEHYFNPDVRDLRPVLVFINDRTDFWGDTIKYPFCTLKKLATRNGIQTIERNSILSNVKMIADCNHSLLRTYIPGFNKPE